ncbi:hypothetical protein SI65_09095 [Aspergillus cristatus]|uniref:Uncharacterized protein n=1 Tax=Aspergillus cristatus TaxID=573508 RepID=A0A1E3B3G2_ASPCR|nr:hypothetical protein SI65_09095 [Aspergillus cristatus]
MVMSESGAFNTYAQRFLYCSISWDWCKVSLKYILQLSRPVLWSPDVASSIKRVDLRSTEKHGWWTEDENLGAYNIDRQIVSCDEFKDVVARAQAIVDEARFPDSAVWKKALQDGSAYAFVAILLSQLHNLCALRLDFTFVWKSGFPGLRLKHALFTAQKGMLSIFESLAVVNYGSNIPIPPDPEYVDVGYVDGHPSCEPGQFMAWFYLPSLRKLWIWLQDCQEILACKRQTSFDRVRSLVLAQPTIREEEAIFLFESLSLYRSGHMPRSIIQSYFAETESEQQQLETF